MKINYLLTVLLLAAFISSRAQYPASNFTLIGQLDPETGMNNAGMKYSGCWGWYQASKNKEYAIAGSQSGTYWVDITNPATPTVSAYKAGSISGATWREIKTYQNYCYVISDDFSGSNSFQIFDMQYLPDSVSKVYDSKALFERAHAAWVDGNKLYLSSVTYSNTVYSTLNVYSLANPASPMLLRQLDQDYPFINQVHDCFVRNDTVFASCAWQGLYVFKFNTANNTFTQLGSLTNYPGSGYNHSSALTPNGQTLVFMDEVPNGLPIKTANVTNLNNIQVLATTNQFTQTTPHNPFMLNNSYCLAASYKEGIQLYDISTPASPALVGYFDTYPQGGGNNNNWNGSAYEGMWGAYPWFPSKTIFGLDMLNGLFLLNTAFYSNNQVASAFGAPGAICTNKTFSVTNNSINANTYTWTASGPATLLTSTLNSLSFTFNTPGIYTITLAASDGVSTAISTKTIQVLNPPQITLNGNPVSCSGCGLITSTITSGQAPYTYSWSPTIGFTPSLGNLSVGCYTLTVKDANTCVNTASFCLVADPNVDLGLPTLASAAGPQVYPNPANALLTVEHAGNLVQFKLYDRLGRLIVKGAQPDKALIHLEEYASGVYFLEVESGASLLRHKVVVEH